MVHGRALPAATGVKMVNPELTVIAVGGDGDGLGIGVGHFIHSARRNLDITYMVMNNQIYGLTMGQSSPSSQLGHVTLTAPQGVDELPINPLALSLYWRFCQKSPPRPPPSLFRLSQSNLSWSYSCKLFQQFLI